MADIVIVGKSLQYGMPPGQLFLTISHCRLRMLKRGLATSWPSCGIVPLRHCSLCNQTDAGLSVKSSRLRRCWSLYILYVHCVIDVLHYGTLVSYFCNLVFLHCTKLQLTHVSNICLHGFALNSVFHLFPLELCCIYGQVKFPVFHGECVGRS